MPKKGHFTPVLERIKGKYIVNDCTGCWEWQRSLSSQGKYPTICVTRNRPVYVYRLLWESIHGQIPSGVADDGTRWELHHRCRNKRCINPTHLILASKREHNKEEARYRALLRVVKAK